MGWRRSAREENAGSSFSDMLCGFLFLPHLQNDRERFLIPRVVRMMQRLGKGERLGEFGSLCMERDSG